MTADRPTEEGGDDPELLDFIAEALERKDNGDDVDLEKLCADRPELIPQVAAAVGTSFQVDRLNDTAKDATDDLVGNTLAGRYLLLGRLGVGAMGVAYRGEDRELRRPVAVKVLRAEATRGEEAAKRFAREATTLASLQVPGIVTVFDRGTTDDGRPYLVMELIDGQPLDDLLDRPQPIRDSVERIRALATSLHEAHQAGIFHRDVKPSNVMVRRDGAPVLIDFGIAALDDHTTLASGERGPGTPAYMAPEQLRPGTPGRPAADVYGLCATLYHLLTGRPPYEGSPSQVVARIPHHPPLRAEKLRPELPKDLVAILDRGLERDPNHRYGTTEEFGADLLAFLEFRPTRARYVGPVRRALRALRRSPTVRGAVAVLLVGILVLGYLAWQTADRDHRTAQWFANWKHVEPLLGLNNFGRRIDDSARRGALAARLDRACALDVFPAVSRTVRGVFWFDQGATDRATQEFADLAARQSTALTRELARRYAEAARMEQPAPPTLEDLPAPADAEDQWILAFHLYRNDREPEVAALEVLPLEEQHELLPLLILTARLHAAVRTRGEDRVNAGRDIQQAVIAAETRLGLRTADTAHALGQSLLLQERYGEARNVIEEGLELAPDSFGLLSNACACARRLGDLNGALRLAERAMAIRPDAANPYRTSIAVLLEIDRYGEPDALPRAHELLDRAPLDEAGKQHYEALIHFNEALKSMGSDDEKAARWAIDRAIAIWQRIGLRDEFNLALAEGIVDGVPPFAEQMELLTKTPTDWSRILKIHDWMPDDLSPEETGALRVWLQALARRLAPEIELSRATPSDRSPK